MSRKTTPLNCADNVTNLSPALPAEPQQFAISIASPACPPPTQPPAALSVLSNPPVLAPESAPAAVPPETDRFLQIKIDSLKAKQRSDTFFNSLTRDQACTLISWIHELDNLTEVARRIKAAPPEGFGLTVNYSTLRRLRDAWHAEDLAASSQSMFDVIIDMEQQTDLNQTPRIQGVMNHLLHESTFDLMRKHPASPLLPELLAHIQKLTDLDLRRQKLQLEREKLLLKSPASTHQPKHHRIDLNIVPPSTAKMPNPKCSILNAQSNLTTSQPDDFPAKQLSDAP